MSPHRGNLPFGSRSVLSVGLSRNPAPVTLYLARLGIRVAMAARTTPTCATPPRVKTLQPSHFTKTRWIDPRQEKPGSSRGIRQCEWKPGDPQSFLRWRRTIRATAPVLLGVSSWLIPDFERRGTMNGRCLPRRGIPPRREHLLQGKRRPAQRLSCIGRGALALHVLVRAPSPFFRSPFQKEFTNATRQLAGLSRRRSDQRSQFAASFVAAAVRAAADALEGRTLLSTVTNTNDSGPGSLRQAIMNAASGAVIKFAPKLDGDTIALTSGVLDISKNLTIEGPGASNLTISGGGTSGVFGITADGLNVTISGLTIANGSASSGAGITNGNGTLTLTNDTFSNDQANGSARRRRRPGRGSLQLRAAR